MCEKVPSLFCAKSIFDIDISLKNGVNIDEEFHIWKETPFEYHCSQGNTDLVKHLVKNGCNVSINGFNNVCMYGWVDIFDFLVPLINVNDKGYFNRTPLIHACKGGQVDIVKKLLDMNVSIMETDTYDSAAIHYAAAAGCLEIIDLLIIYGVNLNTIVNTYDPHPPLHRAVRKKHYDIVKRLLEFNIDINQIDCMSMTPRLIAMEIEDEIMIELLNAYGD